ncbi:DUF6783 domain-containing protein [Lachnospiraceae bacterium JLR.KK009]
MGEFSRFFWVLGEIIFLNGRNFKKGCSRACLKIHSRHLHPLICGIFLPNSVNVARYASFIWQKSPTNCRIHLSESNFQTRSRQGQRYRGNRALDGDSNPEGREQSPAQNCALPFSLKTVPFHLTQRRTSPYSFQLNIYQKDFYILPLSQAAPQCGEAGYTSLSVLPCRAPLS